MTSSVGAAKRGEGSFDIAMAEEHRPEVRIRAGLTALRCLPKRLLSSRQVTDLDEHFSEKSRRVHDTIRDSPLKLDSRRNQVTAKVREPSAHNSRRLDPALLRALKRRLRVVRLPTRDQHFREGIRSAGAAVRVRSTERRFRLSVLTQVEPQPGEIDNGPVVTARNRTLVGRRGPAQVSTRREQDPEIVCRSRTATILTAAERLLSARQIAAPAQ